MRPVADQLRGEAVEDGDVGPRPRPQVDVGVAGELDPARIDDDEPGAGDDPLLDPRADDRMGLGRVRPAEQEDVGAVEVLEGVGAAGEAERGDEARGRGGVADPGAVVDVVGADGHPHQLLHQVVLLVRRPGRGDRGDGVGPVLVDDPAELAADVADRLLPARLDRARPPRLISGRRSRSGERTKPWAKRPLTQAWPRLTGASRFGRDLDDLVAGGADVERAADAAVPAGRRRHRLDRRRRQAARSSRSRPTGTCPRRRRRRRSRTRSTARPSRAPSRCRRRGRPSRGRTSPGPRRRSARSGRRRCRAGGRRRCRGGRCRRRSVRGAGGVAVANAEELAGAGELGPVAGRPGSRSAISFERGPRGRARRPRRRC